MLHVVLSCTFDTTVTAPCDGEICGDCVCGYVAPGSPQLTEKPNTVPAAGASPLRCFCSVMLDTTGPPGPAGALYWLVKATAAVVAPAAGVAVAGPVPAVEAPPFTVKLVEFGAKPAGDPVSLTVHDWPSGTLVATVTAFCDGEICGSWPFTSG